MLEISTIDGNAIAVYKMWVVGEIQEGNNPSLKNTINKFISNVEGVEK